MPGFGHVVRGLRSLRFPRGPKSSSTGNGTVDHSSRHASEPAADLSSMLTNFSGSFKDLPQAMVDEILGYLEDDLQTIRACSLTCKALFRSSRPIIHQRLCVVGLEGCKTIDKRGEKAPTLVRSPTLSAAIECGLVRHVRELTINLGEGFGPADLQLFLPQFEMFSRLTSLTLHHFEPSLFLSTFDRIFGYLAQQIHSFQFIHPSGHPEGMLHFISRFPNLDNMGFRSFPRRGPSPSEEYDIPPIRRPPVLRGTLQVADVTSGGSDFLECLARLPSGLRFRSIEFNRCRGIDPGVIIRECSSTVQRLTYVMSLGLTVPRLDLSTCSDLRVLEICIDFTVIDLDGFMCIDPYKIVPHLASAIHSITSPKFHEFTLVVEDAKYSAEFEKRNQRGTMKLIDQALSTLSQRTGMKMAVKGRNRRDGPRVVTEEVFPLMVSAGAFECEIVD